MKIVHVVGGYYPDPMAGTEVYVQSLASALKSLGIESIIAAPDVEDKAYEHNGHRVRRYAMSQTVADIREIYGDADPTALHSMLSLVNSEQPAVVHFHTRTRTASLESLRRVKSLGVPVVVTYHTPTMSCPRGTLLRWGSEICDGVIEVDRCSKCMLMAFGLPSGTSDVISRTPKVVSEMLGTLGLRGRIVTALRMRALINLHRDAVVPFYNEANAVIALCDWSRTVLSGNGVESRRLHLVRHGITYRQEPEAAQPRTENPESIVRLAFLGRIEPIKGIHVVVDALARVPEAQIQLDIYPVGSSANNHYRSNLEQMARSDARIRFLAPLTNEMVVPTLRQYDALVAPSQWLETGPLVVLEAFAAGIPVIGSDLGGIAEIVTDGVDGILVAFDSPLDWQHMLSSISHDRAVLRKLRSGVRSPRTVTTVAAEMSTIYRSLVETNGVR